MSNSGLQVDDDGKVKVSGEMTFSSTPTLYQVLADHTRGAGEVNAIDLSEVGRADSSGLALLLEWQAVAQRHNRKLQIRNAPENLMRLAKLCEADILLDISGRQERSG